MKVRDFDWNEYYRLKTPEERKRYMRECYDIPKVRYYVWYVLPGDAKPKRAGRSDGFESVRELNEYLKELLPRLKSGKIRYWITKEEVIEELV